MYFCTFGNQKRELRFGHKYGSEQYMLPQWSHTYHNVVDLPSYHYGMCWEIQECQMSISNPLIYVICNNKHLQYFFSTVVGFTLAYYSIQYCILLLKVKCTLWGLLFLSRIKTADIKEKRVIYIIFLLNQYTKKVILLQNRPSVNRKNKKEEDLRYDIL